VSEQPRIRIVRDTRVVFLRESLWESVVADLVTFATVVGVIGTGAMLGSEAMQWLGFIMLCTVAFTRVFKENGHRMTIEEAKEYLAKLEQEMITVRGE
jgi:hypothetical protein